MLWFFVFLIAQGGVLSISDMQQEKALAQQESLIYMELSGTSFLYDHIVYSLRYVHGVLQLNIHRSDKQGKFIQEYSYLMTPEKTARILRYIEKTHFPTYKSKAKHKKIYTRYELYLNHAQLKHLQEELKLFSAEDLIDLKHHGETMIWENIEFEQDQKKMIWGLIELFAMEEQRYFAPSYAYFIDQRWVNENDLALVSLKIDRPALLKIDQHDYGVIEHELIFKQEIGKHLITLCPIQNFQQTMISQNHHQSLVYEDCFDYHIEINNQQLKLKLNLRLE